MTLPAAQSHRREKRRAIEDAAPLSIGTRLVAFSLGIGFALLAALALVNHFFPPSA